MKIVPRRVQILVLSIALSIATATTAYALGSGCIGCDMAPATITAPRNHVPAQSLVYWQSGALRPPAAPKPAYVAPTRLPRLTAPQAVYGGGFGIWDCIAKYESGGNWGSRGGMFEGGLQFLNSTWLAAGGGRYAQHAYDATPAQQVEIARSWLAKTSWAQWPNTSRMCGMR